MRLGLFLLIILTLFGCNNGDNGLLGGPTTMSTQIVDLTITSHASKTPVGFELQYLATATASNGEVIDVTELTSMSWSSSNEHIASINANGVATGLDLGTTTISASGYFNGTFFSSNATLEVTDAIVESLVVTPSSGSTPIGLTKSFTAIAYFSDKSSLNVTQEDAVSWRSSDNDIATINDAGVATGLTLGTTTITASGEANGILFSASATLEVTDAIVESLVVTPSSESTPIGLTKSFTAIAYFSDKSSLNVTQEDAISWRSSDDTIATIDKNGVAIGLGLGSTIITASGEANGFLFSASVSLDVTAATAKSLDVRVKDTENLSVAVGLEKELVAILTLSDDSTMDVTNEPNLNWQSSDATITTVTSNLSSGNGIAKGLNVGTANITANWENDSYPLLGSVTLEVTNAVVTDLQLLSTGHPLPVGLETRLTAVATLSDGSSADVTNDAAISWKSSDTNIANVSSNLPSGNGIAFGKSTGDATITAFGEANGKQFSAQTTLKVISAVVTELNIISEVQQVTIGLSQEFTAIATLSDNSTLDVTNDPALSWSSDDENVATVSSNLLFGNGIAKGLTTGFTIINVHAKVNGQSFSASTSLEVSDSKLIALQVKGATGIPVYEYVGSMKKQYTVDVVYSDIGHIEYLGDVQWEAEISPSGLANFDPVSATITTYPQSPEIAGTATVTACIDRGRICDSINVSLFTQIIQIHESQVGGVHTSCEDLGYHTISPEAFTEIFNSEFKPSDTSNWESTQHRWSYGLKAKVYGRLYPKTEHYMPKAGYIVTGATNPDTGKEYHTDEYEIFSTSYGAEHLICSID